MKQCKHPECEDNICMMPMTPDPRDPDYSRSGVFVDHNCYVCDSGKKPCIKGNPRDCDTLRARND